MSHTCEVWVCHSEAGHYCEKHRIWLCDRHWRSHHDIE